MPATFQYIVSGASRSLGAFRIVNFLPADKRFRMSEAKLREWLKHNNVREFTCQLAELGAPITSGSFGQVYQRTVVTDEGKTVVCLTIPNSSGVRLSNIHQVAVKKFLIDHGRAMAKMEKGVGQRELTVWLKLRHSTIVPLLGIAFLDHPFPA
ncbi:hypothetical protein M405DRAFT_877781, partial [Rhizopogon salebrosus TDB-379]